MATVMLMRWEGVTEDQYEQVIEKVGWEREVPEGAKLHVAGFSDGGMNVLDVWSSAEAFGTFQQEKLAPAIQEAGMQGEPEVRFYPLHACNAPAYDRAEVQRDL